MDWNGDGTVSRDEIIESFYAVAVNDSRDGNRHCRTFVWRSTGEQIRVDCRTEFKPAAAEERSKKNARESGRFSRRPSTHGVDLLQFPVDPRHARMTWISGQFSALMVRSSASRPPSRCSMRAGTGNSGTIRAISSLLPSARETLVAS